MASIGSRLTVFASIVVPLCAVAAHDPPDSAISRVMSEYVKPDEPGCTVGVTLDGSLAHALPFGLSDLESGKPLDTHSVFNLASVSKQFTAFALLLLEQDGKLGLDDPVAKYVPEIARSSAGVTLRHLMHHTGGLRDYIEILYMNGRNDADGATIDEAVRILARQTKPNEAPGVEFDYSNTGYFLLGVVVARVSGQSLAEFSRTRIFEPLGMANTSIVDSYPAAIPALARGYSKAGAGFRVDETGWEQVGDGQVHSDLHDLALWDENFYTGKVGGRALVKRMYEVGHLNSGKSTGYGAGLNVYESRGLTWVTHDGFWAGYPSSIRRVPSEHLSIIVLCNRADAEAGEYADQIAEILLKDKLGPRVADEDEEGAESIVAAAWDPGDLSRFAGAYYSEEADARCVLDQRGPKLVLESCAAGQILKPGKAGEFMASDDDLSLRFAPDGKDVDSFIYWTPDLRGLKFTRVQEQFE